MYAFPQVLLPEKYVANCRSEKKMEPDSIYCEEVLRKVGVVMVPGNGFEQRPGTYHYRMTILPAKKDLVGVLKGLYAFQKELYAEWGVPAELAGELGDGFPEEQAWSEEDEDK